MAVGAAYWIRNQCTTHGIAIVNFYDNRSLFGFNESYYIYDIKEFSQPLLFSSINAGDIKRTGMSADSGEFKL